MIEKLRFESFSLFFKEYYNELVYIFRMYFVLFFYCFNDKFKKKVENKIVFEFDSDDIIDLEFSFYLLECNKCFGVRFVCLFRCNCFFYYLCIYFEKEFKLF